MLQALSARLADYCITALVFEATSLRVRARERWAGSRAPGTNGGGSSGMESGPMERGVCDALGMRCFVHFSQRLLHIVSLFHALCLQHLRWGLCSMGHSMPWFIADVDRRWE